MTTQLYQTAGPLLEYALNDKREKKKPHLHQSKQTQKNKKRGKQQKQKGSLEN